MKPNNHIKAGEKIGQLKVIYRYRKGKKYYYHCECDCGSTTNVEASQLEHRRQTTCLCKGQFLEIGKTYDRLTVRKRIRRGVYECDCACGKSGIHVTTADILKHNVRSCGCASEPFNRKVRKDSSTGIRGVSIHNASGKYTAYIGKNGKNHYLGIFSDKKDAQQARENAEKELQQEKQDNRGDIFE